MKLSLITVVYNARDTIRQCMESVIGQQYNNLEYIVIDGGSTDGTLGVIKDYQPYINTFISEPDAGIYDAMNKGIQLATGDVVGMLNADDHFVAPDILSLVAGALEQSGAEVVYGDLDIINHQQQIIRKWRSAPCNRASFARGFMPPHPTFYCKRELFDRFGGYSLDYGSAADYELMLRMMYRHSVKSTHLNRVMINMLTGGVSNKGLINRLKAWKYDLKARRVHQVPYPMLGLVLKPLQKISQFF